MRLSGSDVSVTVLTLFLAAVLLYLYVQDTHHVTVRSDESPLGTIVFKKLNATRRTSDTLVWERIHDNSPVYERDTLRTAQASEASIVFDDGARLDMNENSMLRLSFAGKERTIEFFGGSISVSGRGTATAPPAGAVGGTVAGSRAAGGATNAYAVSAGNRTISVASASAASLTRSGDTLSVAVAAGEVAVKRSDGSVETLDPTKELEVGLETGRSRVIEHPIVALVPVQDARLLVERPGSAGIEFRWDAKSQRGATLELAGNREFAPVSIATTVTGRSARAMLHPGTWYWRVRTPGGATSVPRRFTLYAEPPPRPILPAEGARVRYRRHLPEIHFSWTAMPDATAYVLEVASDQEFSQPAVRTRTNLENLTVDTLGEGRWYWRVVPLYAMTPVEKASAPEVRTLTVQPRPEMTALTPTAPLPGSLFLFGGPEEKGVSFSWVPDAEATEYELSVSPSRQMTEAVVTRSSTRPWLTLSGVDAAAFARAGDWYWAVRWKDAEGNLSPYSDARLLVGAGRSATARLLFPPDRYTIADSLVASTRFAWKSALPARTVFQLSRDESFSSIAWEEQCAEGTLIGRRWQTGRWFWRIRTLNADGSLLFETPARLFDVVDPLPAPRLLAPQPGGSFSLRAADDYDFSWGPVAGADYYQFKLYSVSADGTEDERYSTTLETTTLSLPLGEYPHGEYRLVLQAFGRDKASSTRLFGYPSRSEFFLTPITHIELSAPADRTEIAGLDARRHGVELSWTVPDSPESSELLLSTDPGFKSIVLRSSGAAGSVLVRDLAAGDYYWTVKGRLRGSDISAFSVHRFTVMPIPLLPAPRHPVPPFGKILGPADFRARPFVHFAWDKVTGATQYLFALYRGSDPVPILRPAPLSENSYTLADLSTLDRGEYRWTVRAQALDRRGVLEQDGAITESDFSVNLPPLRAPVLKQKERFYGR